MNTKEADKIIAEYMGVKISKYLKSYHTMDIYDGHGIISTDKYSKSLDALVPVWEKYGKSISEHGYVLGEIALKTWEGKITFLVNIGKIHECGDVKQVAIATAKAIKELKKNE